MELDQDMSTSKANSKGKGVSTFHRENLSASEINHGSKSSLEEAGGGAEVQLLRMEFLHDVSRAVLLIVRHRGPNVTVSAII